jgi:hypothetical protein
MSNSDLPLTHSAAKEPTKGENIALKCFLRSKRSQVRILPGVPFLTDHQSETKGLASQAVVLCSTRQFAFAAFFDDSDLLLTHCGPVAQTVFGGAR